MKKEKLIIFFTLIISIIIYICSSLFIEKKYHKFSQNDLFSAIVIMQMSGVIHIIFMVAMVIIL